MILHGKNQKTLKGRLISTIDYTAITKQEPIGNIKLLKKEKKNSKQLVKEDKTKQ